jgi:hypothetical protein
MSAIIQIVAEADALKRLQAKAANRVGAVFTG